MSVIDPSASRSWLLPASAITLWISVAFVSVTTKCLVTNIKSCTRWGPEKGGADFQKPWSTAFLHLFVVGTFLAFVTALKDLVVTRRRPRLLETESLLNKAKLCLAVGCTFGIRTVIAHWALQVTPATIFELFQGVNIVFIFLAAWIVVDEKPASIGEAMALFGVFIGSTIAASGSFYVDSDNAIGLFAFILNIANGLLTGAVIPTLRWTTTRMDDAGMTIAELTCLKTLIGAAVVFPFAIGVEGDAVFHMSSMQRDWMLITSAIILIYHLNLSLICYLAPALVVGVVEAMNPLSAFFVTALVQSIPHTSLLFWVGTFITLASAISFKLFRTLSGEPLQNTSREYLLDGDHQYYHHHELGHRFSENTPLNDRIGNDAESDSDAGSHLRFSEQ